MIELNSLLKQTEGKKAPSLASFGYMEAFGNYYFPGIGFPEMGKMMILTGYYDANATIYTPISTKKENIVANLIDDCRIAFVRRDMAEQFKKDAKECEIPCYVEVDDFEEEVLSIDLESGVPAFLQKIVWVDDDFLYSEDTTIPFDFEAFQIIDSGIPYLNPKHFSLYKMQWAIEEMEMRS